MLFGTEEMFLRKLVGVRSTHSALVDIGSIQVEGGEAMAGGIKNSGSPIITWPSEQIIHSKT